MLQFKGSLKQSGIFSKLLLLVGVTSFFTLVALLLWQISTNGNSTDVYSIKLMQLYQSIGMFVIPPFILAYFLSKKPLMWLHIDKKAAFKSLVLVVAFMVIIIPFVNLLGEFNHQLRLPAALSALEDMMKSSELQTAKITEQLLNVHSIEGLLFNVFLIAMLPALGEELFFRGILQRVFSDWRGAVVSIWLTAFIFSAIHLQFYGFLPRLLLGAFFGYLLLWSGNLWLPIIAHFINNFMAVVFFYLKNNDYKVVDIDKIGTEHTQWIGWVSGVVAVVGIIWIQRQCKKPLVLC